MTSWLVGWLDGWFTGEGKKGVCVGKIVICGPVLEPLLELLRELLYLKSQCGPVGLHAEVQ